MSRPGIPTCSEAVVGGRGGSSAPTIVPVFGTGWAAVWRPAPAGCVVSAELQNV